MRRLSSVFVAAVLSAGTFAFVTAAPAGAASAKSCSSSSSGSKSNGMDMGHMDMGSGSKAMKNCPTVAGARQIPVTASAFQFSPSTITVAAGENVTIVLTSTDLEHDFTVQKVGHIVHAKPNKTAKGGLMIKKAGTYKFWCTVKGHKAQGMVGTITVTP